MARRVTIQRRSSRYQLGRRATPRQRPAPGFTGSDRHARTHRGAYRIRVHRVVRHRAKPIFRSPATCWRGPVLAKRPQPMRRAFVSYRSPSGDRGTRGAGQGGGACGRQKQAAACRRLHDRRLPAPDRVDRSCTPSSALRRLYGARLCCQPPVRCLPSRDRVLRGIGDRAAIKSKSNASSGAERSPPVLR